MTALPTGARSPSVKPVEPEGIQRMSIVREFLGLNEDGTPHFAISSSDGLPIVMTGKVYGPVTTPDGTVYDVSDPFIEVAHEGHALHVSDAIGDRHVAAGHPDFIADPNVDSYGYAHKRSDGALIMSSRASEEAVAFAAAAHGVDPSVIVRVES